MFIDFIIIILSSPKDISSLLLEREEGRKRNMVAREKHWLVASHTHSDQELNLQTPQLQDDAPTNWATLARAYWIFFREEGGGREKERNIDVRAKHWSPPSCTCPDQGPHPQPRYVLCNLPTIKPATFWCMRQCSNQLSHLAREALLNFNHIKVYHYNSFI